MIERPLRWQQGFNQEGTVGTSHQGHIKYGITVQAGEEKEIKRRECCVNV